MLQIDWMGPHQEGNQAGHVILLRRFYMLQYTHGTLLTCVCYVFHSIGKHVCLYVCEYVCMCFT
jgi:hypothetical protein